MADKRTTYLIQDPYDDDAVQFIRTIFTYFGLRPLCFYTDRKGRFYGERQYPILTSDLVEAALDVRLDDLGSFAETVRARYDIAGIVPYREDTIEVAADLCELLDLHWNDPAILRRFRDKAGQKRHISEVDATIRIPRFRAVHSASEIFDEPVPDRFVVKPNTGYGNRAIGIFDRHQREDVAAHMARHPVSKWILEQYIGGDEYNCNGQVRGDGDVMIHGVFRIHRREVNDYSTVYAAEVQCHTDHPAFGPIVDYARRLLASTGLRSCPFHLEVKFDEQGPCFFDLGARFPSHSGSYQLARLNPDRPDVHAIAAHDYLGRNSFASGGTDWNRHDQTTSILMYGISEQDGVIASLDGIDEVEAMAEFVHWVHRPSLGDRLVQTRELLDTPYAVMLVHDGSDATTDRLLADVRSTIQWNKHAPLMTRVRARATRAFLRGLRKLRWMTAKTVRPRGSIGRT